MNFRSFLMVYKFSDTDPECPIGYGIHAARWQAMIKSTRKLIEEVNQFPQLDQYFSNPVM